MPAVAAHNSSSIQNGRAEAAAAVALVNHKSSSAGRVELLDSEDAIKCAKLLSIPLSASRGSSSSSSRSFEATRAQTDLWLHSVPVPVSGKQKLFRRKLFDRRRSTTTTSTTVDRLKKQTCLPVVVVVGWKKSIKVYVLFVAKSNWQPSRSSLAAVAAAADHQQWNFLRAPSAADDDLDDDAAVVFLEME